MKQYFIKVTYLEGPHSGKTYYLRKGGYVVDLNKDHFADATYKTKGIANRECERLRRKNEVNVNCERQDNECNIKRGKPGKIQFIYVNTAYEPYAVTVINN